MQETIAKYNVSLAPMARIVGQLVLVNMGADVTIQMRAKTVCHVIVLGPDIMELPVISEIVMRQSTWWLGAVKPVIVPGQLLAVVMS